MQSQVNPKQIVLPAHISRVSLELHVFASNFDWFTVWSVFFVIGQGKFFCLGFTALN